MGVLEMNKQAGIVGMGSYVPSKILDNFDLEKMVETSDEWIRTRTGIEERRMADADVYTSDLAAEAALRALKDAQMTPEEVELIILATVTPDMYTPSTACIVQDKIGAVNAAAFDINAACSGFLYALAIANQFIKTGCYNNVLVIGADTLTKVTDWKDRNTCVLFGDGAGAAVIKSVDEDYGILGTHMGADGAAGKVLTVPGIFSPQEELDKRISKNPRTIFMEGQEVFKFAVKIMVQATKTVVEEANLTIEDIDVIVPHQANIRIIDSAAKRLKIDKDKVFVNLNKYGNMSAASVPVALSEAVEEQFIKKGDLVVLVGFGGGLTWGSALMRWAK